MRYETWKRNLVLTLMARVLIAMIMSSEPPRMRLSSSEGSYSQMAIMFSTTAIFVIYDMTSTLPRLTTWAKQLRQESGSGEKLIKVTHTVIVFHCCPTLEDHSSHVYPQFLDKSCYYYLCCPMLLCRAAWELSTNYGKRGKWNELPLFSFCP